MRYAAALALVLGLTACAGASADSDGGEPRRYTDYDGTVSPAADQCSLPVEERTGGWFCYEAR